MTDYTKADDGLTAPFFSRLPEALDELHRFHDGTRDGCMACCRGEFCPERTAMAAARLVADLFSPCPTCEGMRWVFDPNGGGEYPPQSKCPTCDGRGMVLSEQAVERGARGGLMSDLTEALKQSIYPPGVKSAPGRAEADWIDAMHRIHRAARLILAASPVSWRETHEARAWTDVLGDGQKTCDMRGKPLHTEPCSIVSKLLCDPLP